MTTENSPGFIRTPDGVKLFYCDWGTGKPVVFLSSWSLSSASWKYQMLALSERGLRCVGFDRRGHGRSTDPGRGYDFDTLADDLAAVLDTLDLHGATLVGHSMGCNEIVRYLERHGDGRVARIALLGPTLPMLQQAADNPDGVPASVFDSFRTAELNTDFAKWIDGNMAPFLSPTASPGMANWVRSMALTTSGKALYDCHRAVTSSDFRSALARIDVPTLVIAGELDVSAPLELTARRAAALVPGAHLEVYAGAAHGMFLTHMERVNHDLLEFIHANDQIDERRFAKA
jgi:non-heme chloroperoxidase